MSDLSFYVVRTSADYVEHPEKYTYGYVVLDDKLALGPFQQQNGTLIFLTRGMGPVDARELTVELLVDNIIYPLNDYLAGEARKEPSFRFAENPEIGDFFDAYLNSDGADHQMAEIATELMWHSIIFPYSKLMAKALDEQF